MLYIVTGFGRCGTSLMMQCLKASGVEPWYDQIAELGLQINNEKYLVNKEFLEVSSSDYRNINWNASVPDGRAMKIGPDGIKYFTPGIPVKVILMDRDPMAIKRSFSKFINFDARFTDWPASYYRIMERARERLSQRDWVDWVEVNFHDLVDRPKEQFKRIQDLGVPLNMDKCLELLNPDLCRCR